MKARDWWGSDQVPTEATIKLKNKQLYNKIIYNIK